MSLQRNTHGPYLNRWGTPTAGHPQGPFQNRTSPTSQDGSFSDQAWANDWDGFMSSLLDGYAPLGVTTVAADGSVDAVGASQYFDQLIALINAKPGYASGDHAASADNAGMISRGFVLANIPPLIQPVYAYSDFVAVGTYPGSLVTGVAVNAVNNDVFATDSSGATVYKLTGGSGTWNAIGSYPGGSVAAVAVDETSGDVWAIDTVANVVYKLVGGTGTFSAHGTYPDTNLIDMAFNQNTQDLWLISSAAGDSSIVYKLPMGTTTYSATGSYPGDRARRIGVNSGNDDVFVVDIVTPTSNTTHQTDQLYVLTGGVGRFRQIQHINFAGTQLVGIAVDRNNNDLLVSDSTGDSIFWRSSLGTERFINQKELSSVFVDRIAINDGDNTVWLADTTNNVVLKSTRTITTPATDWYVKS
ncbi:MAG: hypothetical protein JKY11_06455 [Alphaproteobacteria bacterium]|nr:hypothetical protein [Alphaproteobacteria bacterium]